MKTFKKIATIIAVVAVMLSCTNKSKTKEESMQLNRNKTAKDILGNPEYLAISYGGYRKNTRDIQPTVLELKEDLKILNAMGIKMLRTYNVQLAHASNVLKAIKELKKENEQFEMYVMLGAWIDCLNAWTGLEPNHYVESPQNADEIDRAVALAKQYPDIVKILAVGNEAMVRWATSYYVQPEVILKWVNHLQNLKKEGDLPKDLWVTSSDDFASWGGGDPSYRTPDLEKIIEAVDYVSMHTYPMHNTHYNPEFWGVLEEESHLSKEEQIEAAMKRAITFAVKQYDSVCNYLKELGVNKPVHIGETGWATLSSGHYDTNGSRATDEYKEALYYNHMRKWSNENKISCFYFEAFDEPWKDAHNKKGSENHFGLITAEGQAKYALWNFVDSGLFQGLGRGGNPIAKTYSGNKDELMQDVHIPHLREEIVLNY